MAIIGNKLYRDIQSKTEESTEVDHQLAKLEDDIRRLKIEFDVYFFGGVKRPPLEARARLDTYIKRMAETRNLTFAPTYYFNNLDTRFTS